MYLADGRASVVLWILTCLKPVPRPPPGRVTLVMWQRRVLCPLPVICQNADRWEELLGSALRVSLNKGTHNGDLPLVVRAVRPNYYWAG